MLHKLIATCALISSALLKTENWYTTHNTLRCCCSLLQVLF